MNKIRLIVAAVALGLSAVWAQQPLVSWEFNTAGDSEGWVAAHALAPLVVADGTLKTMVTSGDPYMHSSTGESFRFQANDFQYIETRLKLTGKGAAEFFWANTVEGKDAGFAPGQERGFPCLGDGQWHTYILYPLWQGEVTRLRFDALEGTGGALEIDYIRVLQGPISQHDPGNPEWDLSGQNGAWLAISGGTPLQPTPAGGITELTADKLQLVSPPLALKAADYRYAFLQFRSTAPLAATLLWSATGDANFPGCNALTFALPAGESTTNLPLAPAAMFAGDVRRLAVVLEGPVGTQVTFCKLALAAAPRGPGRLQVDAFAARAALTVLGRPGQLLARLSNGGGETLRAVRVTATAPAGMAEISGDATRTIASLAPGASTELTWEYRVTREGPVTFGLDCGTASATAETMASQDMPTPQASAQPTAQAGERAAWIANDRVALVVVRSHGSFARGQLSVFAAGQARSLAVLPHLAVLGLADNAALIDLSLTQAQAATQGDEATLTLSGATTQGPATITTTLTLKLSKGRSWIDMDYTLTTDQALSITAFRGPWLWAGEGSFGDQQDLALFPGLEYMEAGEKSSSTLDIAPPANLRFAPHPNMITVPSMAVEKGGDVVGLMWDPLQTWDGKRQKPTAVFASPNFVENHANHLLGLCLPSIPEYMQPNDLRATTPYALAAGKTLTLAGAVYAEADSEVLRAMDLYLARYGTPPLPPPARSYTDTLTMSLKSYENVMWVEAARGWMGVIGWTPGPDLGVALHYLLASRHVPDAALAATLAKKGLSLGAPGDLRFALHHYGQPGKVLAGLLGSARAKAAAVPADGKFGFAPAPGRESLGSAGTTASGLCADAIRALVDEAYRTADLTALAGALRTLKLMEGMKIPRASQVWEVPVHTPDILASGNVALAYLRAYQLTGDPAHLRRAVYWARTGLPFIYMWQAPEQPSLMLGATIPVFGATMYTGSWFGVPVQWNGLAYAQTLQELARYDTSLPWRHFAEMITISGINTQSTRDQDYGTYTDNWNVVSDVECVGCMLTPAGIVDNVLALLAVPNGVQTAIVRLGGPPVAINSAALIGEPRLAAAALQFTLRYDAGFSAYSAVMPLAEPERVEVDGAELARQRSLVNAAEGWSYEPQVGCVTLKLAFGAEPRTVRLIKPQVITAGLPTPGWEFDATGDAEGWSPAHSVAPFQVADGTLKVTVTGVDPYLLSPGFSVAAAACPAVVFRARATAPGGQVFFTTDEGGLSADRQVSFHLPADGQFHDVRVEMTGNPLWKGTVRQIRLDFMDAPCAVELDWIRIPTAKP
jgi:hypothetical protein